MRDARSSTRHALTSGLAELRHMASLQSEMTRLNTAGRDAARRVQEERFRALLRYAAERSPFYRERLRGLDPATCPAGAIAPLTKREMMANFDRIVTAPELRRGEILEWMRDGENLGRAYRGRFVPFQSSGSSGEYALVVYDKSELATFYASLGGRPAFSRWPTKGDYVRALLTQMFVKRTRHASVVMTGAPTPAYTLALHAPAYWSRLCDARIFSVLEPLDQLAAKLEQFQPETLLCYPSVLAMLAREQLAGRIDLKFPSRLSTIVAGSEPLPDATKALVRRAWNVEVQDTYSMSECFVVGRSCSRFDRLHVMTDACMLEVVDRDNRPVPDGQMGHKVLVTNLFNFTQPIIRYEVTDVVGYSAEPCGCSWPFPTLQRVEGRSFDVFYVERPGGGYEAVLPHRLAGGLFQLAEIRQSQLVQTARAELTLRYVPADDADVEPRLMQVLQRSLRDASLEGRLSLKLERVAAIPNDPVTGKYKQFVNVLGEPADLSRNGRAAAAAP